MGSLVPFQDLNLTPEVVQPTTASPTVPITPSASLLVPKIEPKQEPFDELPPIQQQPPPGFPDFASPNPALDLLLNNSQVAPVPDSSVADAAADQEIIESEYNRIAVLFRQAFAEKMKQEEEFQAIDPDSRAIVPVPEQEAPMEEDNRELALSLSRRRSQRSGELVRVTNLGIEDIRHFRNEVRRTRRVYDCIRLLAAVEEERKNPGMGRRARGDLRASGLMRGRGLWLNNDKRIVGSIPGIEIGDVFFFRMELCMLGLHGQPQAGIDYLTSSLSSNGEPIATSIIVSGGYEDDQDAGDIIIYTGHGGRDKGKSSRQCSHQKLEGGNLALERSMRYGIEVRVIRGIRYENSVSSAKVYVYDGLYRIIDCWFDIGKSGFGVFKYKLIRMEGQPEMGSSVLKFAESLKNKPLSARPMGYVSLDISMSRENLPVFLYNDIDCNHDPMYYEYLVKTVFPPFVISQANNGGGCACVSGCAEGCFCALKNGGEFAYDYNGLLLRGKPVIFECGAFCHCPPNCRNRVSQRGLKNKLEVFRTRETGWGVRSLDLIEPGAFICEYAGVVLTKEQAEVFAMDGDTLIYPGRFSGNWTKWGDLSQIFPDFVHPSYPPIPPLDFAMDVSRMRNVACYMSHSPTPNVLVQFVLYDHNNMMFPRLMLFATEAIPPLRELSLDYGVADEGTGKLSICS